MKDFVSHRRVSILAAAASISILWAIFVVPGGAPWTGFVWLGALVFLLVSTVAMVLKATSPPALSQVIRGVEDEPTGRKR